MTRSRRVALASALGSLPCLVIAYPAAMRLQVYCDLTPSEVRSVLWGFALLALAIPILFSFPLRTRRKTAGDALRPLIVRKTLCTLCSTMVDVPLEDCDWARCPNCGALVPI